MIELFPTEAKCEEHNNSHPCTPCMEVMVESDRKNFDDLMEKFNPFGLG